MNPYLATLDLLRERGWVKGKAESPDGRVCLGRALETTVGDLPLEERERHYAGVCRILDEVFPIGLALEDTSRFVMGARIIRFNDHWATLFEDVEVVLEKAAARWEEQQ